jgi:hypothetical protein
MELGFTWLPNARVDLQRVATALRLRLTWSPNPPASELEIADCERKLACELPLSFKTFLQIANGAELAYQVRLEDGNDRGGCTIILLSTVEIVSRTEEYKGYFTAREVGGRPYCRWGRLVIFADCEDGNYCVFDAEASAGQEYPVCYMEGETVPDAWRQENRIADTFEEWLTRVFASMIELHKYPTYWQAFALDEQASARNGS